MEFLRQLDLVPPAALQVPVHLVGCGGIGSFVGLALAKLGCRHLALYDDDVVEPHNVPNQAFRPSDVGRPKVEALAEVLEAFAGIRPAAHRERVEGQRLQGMVVAGVDSMEARRILWSRSIRHRAAVPLFLDGRMGAEVSRLYSIRPADPDDVRLYEGTLYDDAEAAPLPCTASAIIYSGFALAALVASQVKRHAMGEPVPREILCDMRTLTLIAT